MRSGQIIVGPPLTARVRDLGGETLPELLGRAVERDPDAIALVIRRDLRDGRQSYRQLAATVERVVARLQAAGVWHLGAVIAPLDLRMQPDVAVRIGRRARASLLLAGPDVDPAVASELDVPILGIDEASLGAEHPGGASRSRHPAVDPGDLAEFAFTSGTTSDPKGVILANATLEGGRTKVIVSGSADQNIAAAVFDAMSSLPSVR